MWWASHRRSVTQEWTCTNQSSSPWRRVFERATAIDLRLITWVTVTLKSRPSVEGNNKTDKMIAQVSGTSDFVDMDINFKLLRCWREYNNGVKLWRFLKQMKPESSFVSTVRYKPNHGLIWSCVVSCYLKAFREYLWFVAALLFDCWSNQV